MSTLQQTLKITIKAIILSIIVALLFVSLTGLVVAGQRKSQSNYPIVMVVSFDAFRADYMEKTETPNFAGLATTGVRAKWMKPSYPSLTFPNHQTIVTGLYPESHGITANNFYDPIIDDVFTFDRYEPMWWDTGVTPLYILNEMADDDRHSGSMMWVGSGSSYFNRTPTYVVNYNGSISWKERVDTVIDWMTNDEKPANNVFLYFEEPDQHSHIYGPDSEQVKEQIKRSDNITGYLIQRLREVQLFDKMDLIVTSDHGMSYVPFENYFDLTDLVNRTNFKAFDGSPLIHILPEPGLEDIVYEIFKKSSMDYPYAVYWKDEIPEEFHYRNNARITPIVIITDENYTVSVNHYKYHMFGQHGYNDSLPTMRAFFLAHGPSFKSGYAAEPFHNVDIYPLVSHLLGLQPAPHNGSFEEVKDILRTSMPPPLRERITDENANNKHF